MTERYAMLARENAEIRKTIADQATMLSALSNGKIDAERREALSGLATKYPGLVVADEEFSKCLFSAGSKMTNDDFKTHIETIERFSTRAALVSTQRLPTGVMPTPGKSHDPKDDPTSERYAARCKQAIERHTADMNAGKPMRDFDTILSEVP